MRRRSGGKAWKLVAAGALLLLAVFAGKNRLRGSLRVPKGNLVIFSLDTCRADHLSLYGYGRKTSPRLEKWAKDGVVFESAMSGASSTASSHMTLFTGLPPTVHLTANIHRRLVFQPAPLSIKPLAERLRSEGYQTAGFVGGGNVSADLGFDRGFQTYVSTDIAFNGNGVVPFDASKAVEWLEQAKRNGAPFFLFVHTFIPHSPYLPPAPYDGLYGTEYKGKIPRLRDLVKQRSKDDWSSTGLDDAFWRQVSATDPKDVEHMAALYDGELNYADQAVADFLEALDRKKLRDDTVVVVLSDHGEQFQEHGAFQHGKNLWEELIHVPLLFFLPATRGAGRRVEGVAGALDVLPTLLDLLGMPEDPSLPGRSLLPRMSGGAGDGRPAVSEELYFMTVDEHGYCRPNRYVRSLRGERYKYIDAVNIKGMPDRLFDLSADPKELENRIGDPSLSGVLEEFKLFARGIDELGERNRYKAAPRTVSETTRRQLRGLGYLQ